MHVVRPISRYHLRTQNTPYRWRIIVSCYGDKTAIKRYPVVYRCLDQGEIRPSVIMGIVFLHANITFDYRAINSVQADVDLLNTGHATYTVL